MSVNINISNDIVEINEVNEVVQIVVSGGIGPAGPTGPQGPAGTGTVNSINLTAGTGISVSGGPITTSGNINVVNTAPDQVVALTGAGTTSVAGTYPNFTITSNDQFNGTVTSVGATAGTGITISGSPITTSGALTITNAAPDQVVSITAGSGISTSGTYPSFTVASTITQYTDALSRLAISLTTTGTSGAATYNNSTGVFNIPNYANVVTSVFGRTGAVVATNGDYNTLQVTENTNLYYTEARVDANTNVSANTAARHNALTISTANGLSLSTQALSLALASTSVTGALSSTDFTTFNNKQGTISLTTTGTSGAATFSANTLNIPNYTLAGLGGLPLIGGTLTGALTGTSASFSSTVAMQGLTATTGNFTGHLTGTSATFTALGGGSIGSAIGIFVPNAGHQVISMTSTTGSNGVGYTMTNSGGTAFIGLDNSVGGLYGVGSFNLVIASAGSNPMVFMVNSLSVKALSLASTGDAMFSNTVYSGTSTINPSAQLEADSTIKGFLPPRMTTTQKNAIVTPAAGLIVYDTTLNKLCVRTAAAWETITSV